MESIVNLSLIVLGSMVIVFAISYFLRETSDRTLRLLIPLLGFFATLWCMGYGLMGASSNYSYALIARNVGLFGIIGFMVSETAFLLIEVNFPKKALYTLLPFDIVFSCVDFYLFSQPENQTFVTIGNRTSYYANLTFARSVHGVYITFLFLSLLSLALLWLKKSHLKREKSIVGVMTFANFCLVFSCLPDTILPLLNIPSFPSSAYGGFLVYIMIYFVCIQLNAFHISVQNFSSYIYNYVDANILIFDNHNQLSLLNNTAKTFFNIEKADSQKFETLFEISSTDANELFERVHKTDALDARLVTRSSGTICSVTFNQIKDKFDDPYCTICVVYDLSKEEKLLQEVSTMKDALQEELTEKTHQVERLTLQTISTIANTIDAKDAYTKGHSIRVAEYSAQLAEALGYPAGEVQNVKYIALLHDIGKIGIPDNVLNKPSKLSDLEFELIKSHTTVGGEILKDITMISDAAIGAKFHHERYDGTGYPNKLKGKEIPEIARIICIADSYDAMNSKRVYRSNLTKEYIREELLRCAGSQFDPDFIPVFVKLLDEDKILDNPMSDENSSAIVDESNRLLEQIMENLEQEKRSNAERDALTGLYTRMAGEPLIIEAMKKDNGCLAFIDLDNLKTINDQAGHLVGDHAVTSVSEVLKKNHHNAIIARIGGDEFLYYMKHVNEKEAKAIIEGILHSFRSLKENDKTLAVSSLSVGLCMNTPNDVYADVFAKTDKALYYVKQNGKDGYYFYQRETAQGQRKSAIDLQKMVLSLQKQGDYNGALDVEYRTFTKLYDYINNLIKRYHYSIRLVMITLESVAGTTPTLEQKDAAMDSMENAIRSSLRNVDISTRFSSEQFLIILMNAEPDSVQMIVTRIFNQFYKNNPSQNIIASFDEADV